MWCDLHVCPHDVSARRTLTNCIFSNCNPCSKFSTSRFLRPGFASCPLNRPLAFRLPGFHARRRLPYHRLPELLRKTTPARSLCEHPHRHMDPEKDKNCTNNSDDVVTKAPGEHEAQDAIVYPNVFWTSCVSFGVALGLFLVTYRRAL